MQDQSMNEV
uniref:Uncharacterized protein n=1 Tax=Anguilla anguilla TaxID=7936 RepID=A0A0E9PL57_ANGAN